MRSPNTRGDVTSRARIYLQRPTPIYLIDSTSTATISYGHVRIAAVPEEETVPGEEVLGPVERSGGGCARPLAVLGPQGRPGVAHRAPLGSRAEEGDQELAGDRPSALRHQGRHAEATLARRGEHPVGGDGGGEAETPGYHTPEACVHGPHALVSELRMHRRVLKEAHQG